MTEAAVFDLVMPPGDGLAIEVRRGDVVRIVDVEGQQVADFVCFNLHRLEEKFSPPNTLLINGTVRLTVGHALWSDEAGRMFTIVADTVGLHDVIAGACSRFTNEVRYGVKDTPNCRDNLARVLAPRGLRWKDVPYAFNIFMNVPIEPDGRVYNAEPRSRAGDFVDLRAEMDCLVAISNCPQVLNPCNAYRAKPLRVLVSRPGTKERATLRC
jgi:urea carboxylase-associated protein 1